LRLVRPAQLRPDDDRVCDSIGRPDLGVVGCSCTILRATRFHDLIRLLLATLARFPR
jgi:hypothetical protein